MTGWKKLLKLLLLSLLVAFGSSAVAHAACSTNPNLQACSGGYGVNETHFGSGGVLNACSTSYCSDQTAGDLTVGKTCSAGYCAQTGSDASRMPYLQLVVGNTNVNLGVLKTGSTGTATTTFSVKAYLASGYVVQVVGSPPSNGAYTLSPIATSGTKSHPGVEQFGINLAANTAACGAPANFGANPAQAPDSTFSFGTAMPDYATCGVFKYVNGGQIAYSNSSSGETDYTISYIANISDVTPGGTYITNQTIVATATY